MSMLQERRTKFNNALTVLREIGTTCRFSDVADKAKSTAEMCEEVIGTIDDIEDPTYVALNTRQFLDTMQSVVAMEINFLTEDWDKHLRDEQIVLH
jgi:hypothetical protein